MPPDRLENLFDLLDAGVQKFGNRIFSQIQSEKNWRKVTCREVMDSAISISGALKAAGIRAGEAVAILSENRPEWGIALFGILGADAVAVPIDKLLKKPEIQNILEQSGAKLLFISKQFLDCVHEMRPAVPVICLDEEPGVLNLSSWIKREKTDSFTRPARGRDDTAVMIFTSGTTGNPKGVMLTHGNFLSNIEAFSKIFPSGFFSRRFLSMLPLNHAFELTGGFLTPLAGGGTITYLNSLKPSHFLETARETRSEIILTVPAFLEMLHRTITQKARESREGGRKLKMGLRLASWLPVQTIRRKIFKEIQSAFGGELRHFVLGGAPLSGELQEAFERFGFTVIQGYGLTETAPVLAVNPYSHPRRLSVGKAIPGVEITIGDEGEILARGPNVMKGYYKNPEATALAMRGGYFHTGDVGRFDSDGYLYVTGRIKNMIVLASGKKIFPEEIEEKFKSIHYLKDICVMGRKTGAEEEVIAVVVPDRDSLDADHVPEPDIRSRIWEGIKQANASIADYKRVKDIILWEKEFPKTTTMKVKRRQLELEISPLSAQGKRKDSGAHANQSITED